MCRRLIAATLLIPAPAAAQAPDAVIARLNALEAKVAALEARNRDLEAQLGTAAAPPSAPAAKPPPPAIAFQTPAPTFADPDATFTFRPRGFLQIDYAHYHARRGGYDYNDGTDIRRGRFGFEGTLYKDFAWRLDAEYIKNTVNLLDAYVQYGGVDRLTVTIGQHKAPYGLEANSPDAYASFLERGTANVAFGAVGAERRVGASLLYAGDRVTAAIGLFGAGEAVGRNAATPDEVRGVNARVTWEPILRGGRVLHVGASAYRVDDLAGKAITLFERPESRVDDGRAELVTIGPGGTGDAATRGVRSATFVGGEAAGVYGAFSVQGEYGRLHVDRYDAAPSVDFDGGYAFASLFVTPGDTRAFRGGIVDRVVPKHRIGDGGIGAVELLVRYDVLDLSDAGLSPVTRRLHSWTAGATWYLNPYVKVLANYIRFDALNSPLSVAPETTAAADIFTTRLQFDF